VSSSRHKALVLLLVLALPLVSGCNDYRVRFLYPRESRGDFFDERPEVSLYVAEPEDLRSSTERKGRGFINTLHFPSDDKLEQPPSRIVLRALLQDLNQTRIAALARSPERADYVLTSQLLSMTTKIERPLSAWAVPISTGIAVGLLSGIGSDGGVSHMVKTGLVGVVLGTMLPAPARTTGQVEVRLELRERVTDEVVWSTTCTGSYQRTIRLSMSAREDQRIAEDFLPRALKRANACAVGQLYAFLQQHDTEAPAASR
jgi:hypothetical protein